MQRIIFETKDKVFRIIEQPDEHYRLEDLEGDMYNPEMHTDIDKKTLEIEQVIFRRKVQCFGVNGYILEKWNPNPDCGYEHLDSCWGFVGQYEQGAEGFDHYIVDEMKQTITKETK